MESKKEFNIGLIGTDNTAYGRDVVAVHAYMFPKTIITIH